MRLSTKARFAVTAMIDVALREQFGPVPLNDVASRQKISLSYLEQLFRKLRLQGLVASNRGPGGGYSLGRRTEVITVADIISAVEDAAAEVSPHHVAPVQDIAQDFWESVDAKMYDFTQSVTLKSLVLEQLAIGEMIEQRPSPTRGVFAKPVQQVVRLNVPNSVFALGRTLMAS